MNKLTIDDITGLVDEEKTEIFRAGTMTVVVLTLTNGAQVTGESNCIDPANYDAEMGEKIARDEAISKVWELEGYACKTRGFLK